MPTIQELYDELRPIVHGQDYQSIEIVESIELSPAEVLAIQQSRLADGPICPACESGTHEDSVTPTLFKCNCPCHPRGSAL